MAIPTWRTQAAPDSGAALKAIAEANKQQSLGMATIAKSIGGGSDAYGDIVKNEAYNVLSNVIPGQGESRAAARQRTIADPENKGMFDSSFLGSAEMDNLENTLSAFDAGKKSVSDKSNIMKEINFLSSLQTPEEQRAALTEYSEYARNNDIRDEEKLLQPFADDLLRQTKIQITPELIIKHGGDPKNERSLTPDIIESMQQDIEQQVRQNNKWASSKALNSAFNDIASRSPYKAMFTRNQKLQESKSTIDVELDKHAGLIADQLFHGTNPDLINALQNGAYYLYTNRNNLTPEQASIIEKPLITAMEGMNINALKQYEAIGGDKRQEATVTMQKKFRTHMQKKYREQFKWLTEAVIDKKISSDIQNDDTLGAIFQTGKKLAQWRTQGEKEIAEDALKYKQTNRQYLYDVKKEGNTWAVVARKLEDKINKTLAGSSEKGDAKLRGDNLGKLYNQVRTTIQKLGNLFKRPDADGNLVSNLTGDQKNTFDLAVMKMFTSQGGMDQNGNNWNPFDNATYGLMGLEPGEDMSKLSENQLLEGLKEFLPTMSDRTTQDRSRDKKTRKLSGDIFETKINAILSNMKEVQEPTLEKTNIISNALNTIFPDASKRDAAQKAWTKENGLPMIWYAPETFGPWLLNKYRGSAEQATIEKLIQDIKSVGQ